jgi:Matrixin
MGLGPRHDERLPSSVSRARLLAGLLAPAVVIGALVAAAPPAQARSDPYRFIQGGRTPAFWWDSCAVIDVGLDLRYARRLGMTPEWERIRWRTLLSEVAHYTGYRFTLRDVRTRAARLGPRFVGSGRAPDVVVAFGGADAPRAFRYARLGRPGVGGYGGPSWRGRQATSGVIVLNAEDSYAAYTDARMPPKWAGVDPLRSVYMHEFGHVLGLDHVTDRRQLMYPILREDRDDVLGSGERRAFRLLGKRPCHSSGRPGRPASRAYIPDESLMPIGDASDDPPERCPSRGACTVPEPPEPTPPAPDPAVPAAEPSTLPAVTLTR